MIRFNALDPLGPEYEWDVVRDIRNECREFMTGNTEEITPEQQIKFRKEFNPQHQAVYLLQNDKYVPVGFLYLRTPGSSQWTPTYGVREAHRGKGYGKALVRLSQVLCDRLILEVLRDNHRAIDLYRREGFKVAIADPSVLVMEWRRNW